jgi:hypothetical protein
MLGPGGTIESGAVRLALLAFCRDTQQQQACSPRLANHAGGMGVAFQGAGAGGDIGGGEVGLVGIGREEAGDLGDGGVVAADAILRRVGEGRERGAQRVDELVVDVPGELGLGRAVRVRGAGPSRECSYADIICQSQ